MTNHQKIEDQISTIREYLGIVSEFDSVTVEQMETDHILRGAVERYLYLLVQSTIDLAESIIALHGYRKPTEYREVFLVLFENKLIEPDLSHRLANMVGFRNVLAHEYRKLDFKLVLEFLIHDRADIEEFLQIIEASF